MSALAISTGLSPLLDLSFLTALARQLLAARDRLSLRTDGNLPSVAELIVALRLYITRCDRQRAITADPLTISQGDDSTRAPPRIEKLAYYLALADAAYYVSDDDLRNRLEPIGVNMPIAKVDMAGKWAPGYFVVRDRRYDAVVLVVRGSKEVSDMVTNLSADPEPFLGGVGHRGMVKSAYNLHDRLRGLLARIVRRHRPRGGLVIVGHSLGGAVASLLTMLLRSAYLDREYEEENEGLEVRRAFRTARCYSFCPPPCLDRGLAELSKDMGISCLVAGLDVVPRMSAASLDRFLVRVSRYNWGRDVGDSFSLAIGSMARGLLGEEHARSVTEVVREHGTVGVTLASTALAQTARAALDSARGRGRSRLWSLALNTTVFVGSLVSESLAGSHRRTLVDERRQPDYSFARHFGMSEHDVERVLAEDVPQDVFLAGIIFHLDRPFAVPEEAVQGSIAPARLVVRDCEYFSDIEASAWMVHDHHPHVVLQALEDLELRRVASR